MEFIKEERKWERRGYYMETPVLAMQYLCKPKTAKK